MRRGADRPVVTGEGRTTRHGFSFGEHHDPAWTHHGVLLAHHEDVLAPGAGYEPHPHREVELVTWVLAGTLTHTGSDGTAHEVPAGWVQHVSAGSGIVHAEQNLGTEPVRLLQCWLAPDVAGVTPVRDAGPAPVDLAPAVAGEPGPGVLPLGCGSVALRVGAVGRHGVVLPPARAAHVWVADGHVRADVPGHGPVDLGPGDALLTEHAGAVTLTSADGARVAAWTMPQDLVALLGG